METVNLTDDEFRESDALQTIGIGTWLPGEIGLQVAKATL